jgi:hypothetical protein
MAGEWFLAREGQQASGPMTTQQLKEMAASGQVQATDLVWKQGMPKWVPATQIKGLIPGTGSSGVSNRPVEPPPAPGGDFNWQVEEVPPARSSGRRAAPPPPAPAPADAFAFGEGGGDETEDEDRPVRSRAAGGEPWFYGFLERFTPILMWALLGLDAIAYLYLVGNLLYNISPIIKFLGWMYVLRLLGGATIGAALGALVSIVLCMTIRVIVDCGRSLRSMNKKLAQR